MDIDRLFSDKEYVENEIKFFITKKHIKNIALALITNKKYASKNHYATIIILIKEYAITKDEARLLNELSISKEDAELYTSLKGDRHDASYATNIKFTQETIKEYEEKILDFVNKSEELLQN